MVRENRVTKPPYVRNFPATVIRAQLGTPGRLTIGAEFPGKRTEATAVLNIENILFPADFSECSRHAFRIAQALARDYCARLLVLHVATPPPFITHGEMEKAFQPPDDYGVELASMLRRQYGTDSALATVYRVQDGDPVTEILHMCEESSCDLVVMGTHCRSGVGRLLLGSVAEQVVRRATCPVLTVRPGHPIPPASDHTRLA
jgi:universal stress protein A